MIAIDYTQILVSRLQESKHGYKRALSWYTLVKNFFITRWLTTRINLNLSGSLKNIKEIHSYLLLHIADFKGKSLMKEIQTVEKAIREFTKLESDLEKKVSNPRFEKLSTAHKISQEIIEEMYAVLRLLKKNSLKTPLPEASEEARIAVAHSQNTLNKKLNDRSST